MVGSAVAMMVTSRAATKTPALSEVMITAIWRRVRWGEGGGQAEGGSGDGRAVNALEERADAARLAVSAETTGMAVPALLVGGMGAFGALLLVVSVRGVSSVSCFTLGIVLACEPGLRSLRVSSAGAASRLIVVETVACRC